MKSAASAQSLTGAPHARPVLFLHGAGLALLYIGLAIAFATGTVPGATTIQGVVGTVIILFAAGVMGWSSLVLRSWRLLPKVEADHELCTTGPYGFVRHPMYLAINLLGVGSAVWAPAGAVILATLMLIVGSDLRGRMEEKVLLEAFGDRYRDYQRRVWRTLPGIY